MKPQPLQSGSKNIGSTIGPSGRWLGAGLALAAVVAIAVAIYASLPPAATSPAANGASNGVAQSVPDAAAQGVNGYLRAHGAGQVDTAPDAARRVARDLQRASGQGAASLNQAAPDANVQAVLDYVRTHGAGSSNVPSIHDNPSFHSPRASSDAAADRSFHTPQTSNYVPAGQPAQAVPDANTQSVLDYLRAHGANAQPYVLQLYQAPSAPDAIGQTYFLQLYTTLAVPDANTQSVLDYLRAHDTPRGTKCDQVPDPANCASQTAPATGR